MSELKSCPLCKGHIAFHGDDECSGCHLLVCDDCRAIFDLSSSVDPGNQCESLANLQAAITLAWNSRAEPKRVSRIDVLSLSEAARCLGVAQAKNDADAIASWKAESLRLESAICAKAEPEKVEPVAVAALEAVWCHGYSAGHQDGLGCGHPMSGRCPHTSAHELEYHRDDIMALAAPQQEQK